MNQFNTLIQPFAISFSFSACQCSFSEWSSIIIIAYITLDHFTAQSIHICIINIDVTLMFYVVQYIKTTSVRCHTLMLVSNLSCPFKVKKNAAQAYLLPWFQKINGGMHSALRLMHCVGWIGLLSSNSCIYYLAPSVLLLSPFHYFLCHLLESLVTWDCFFKCHFYRTQHNGAEIFLITHLKLQEQGPVHARGSNSMCRHMKEERWEQHGFVASLFLCLMLFSRVEELRGGDVP